MSAVESLFQGSRVTCATSRTSWARATSNRRAGTRHHRHRTSQLQLKEIAWTPWTLEYYVHARARLAAAKPLRGKSRQPPSAACILSSDDDRPLLLSSHRRGASLSPRLTLQSILAIVRARFLAPRARRFTRRHPALVDTSPSWLGSATKNISLTPPSLLPPQDVFFLLYGAAMVFFMQAGFAMLEVGSGTPPPPADSSSSLPPRPHPRRSPRRPPPLPSQCPFETQRTPCLRTSWTCAAAV